MQRQALLDTQAYFTWKVGKEDFYVVADGKRYIWSSPAFGGNNLFQETNMSYKQWIGHDFGRENGTHVIRDYCGPDIKISLLTLSADKQGSKLKSTIECFAKKHGVSVDVAKKMMSDRHNEMMKEAEDTVKNLDRAYPSPLMEHETSSITPDSPTGTT